MWTSEGDGEFDVSGYGSSPITQNTNSNRKNKRADSVFPIAIKQVINEKEENLIIHGLPATILSFVGIIRKIDICTTKIIYTIQDWSGKITGLYWMEEGKNEHSKIVENSYCRITGTRRVHDDKVCLFVYSVKPIENLAELTYHYLQVIHIGLKAGQLRQEETNSSSHVAADSMLNTFNNNNNNNNNSSMGGSDDSNNFSPHQRQVYSAIKSKDETVEGLSETDLYESLKSRMSKSEITSALEFLKNEGFVYTSIDDEHYKVTDA